MSLPGNCAMIAPERLDRFVYPILPSRSMSRLAADAGRLLQSWSPFGASRELSADPTPRVKRPRARTRGRRQPAGVAANQDHLPEARRSRRHPA